MATNRNKKRKPKAELKEKRVSNKVSWNRQFQGLDTNDPGQWPFLPQLAVCMLVAALVVAAAWFLVLNDKYSSLERAQAQEFQLKDEFLRKWRVAVNLKSLQSQQEQVQQYVSQLEAKLPNAAQLDSLLRDISNAAESSGLSVEVLKAEPFVKKEYYIEQPISVEMTGKGYHDFGRFAETLASLERIVTLDSVELVPLNSELGEVSGVRLKGTLRTYRYMSDAERSSDLDSEANRGS